MAADIDSFIREQKAKLATERKTLADRPSRRRREGGTWHIMDPIEMRQRLALQDALEYRALWEEIHGKKSPRTFTVPLGSKKKAESDETRRAPHTFDPRIERNLYEVEYGDLWKEEHGGAQSQKQGNRSWREPSEEKLLPVGQSEGRKKQLERERNREYNEYLKSKDGGNRTWREPSAEKLLPLGDYEQKRKAVEEARKTEYQEFLRKTAEKRNRRLWKEASHEGLLLSDEPHLRKRERLKSERQQEYRQYLREQNTERRNLAQQTDEYKAKASFPGMNESDNAKIQKERERNEEYNQFLREKNPGRRPEAPPEPDQGFIASLPGLRDSDSAKKRKEQQRNAEYNLYLQSKRLPAKTGDAGRPPVAPRNVWATPVPSYDDLLDRKRVQESQYRRSNDYDIPLESERKLAELDKELEIKKARLRNERQSQGVLDDPTWLSPRKPSDIQYENLGRRERRNTVQDQSSSNYASLPLGEERIDLRIPRSYSGADLTEYEKKRQQDQYRQDLQKQIQEAADGKQRGFQKGRRDGSKGVGLGGRAMDLKVDYSGYIDPEERKAPTLVMASTRRQRQAPFRAYEDTLLSSLEKLDQISPRSEVILGRRRLEEFNRGDRLGGPLPLNRGTARGGGIGATDTGFETMVEGPSRLSGLAPPPGLQYQPASYITQGGGGGLGQSSVDEAYTFYATRNPLEEVPVGGGEGGGGGGGGGGRGGGRRGRADQEVSFPGGGGFGIGGPSRARIEEEKRYGARRPMDFANDEDSKQFSQIKAQAYQEELSRQIEENRRKKMKEREEKERYDRKIEQEARDYNPYGRGGGGAPMRDSYGNLVTDLRSMHRDNENVDSPRRGPPPPNPYLSPRGPTNVRDDLIGPPPVQTTAEGEQSYARGGHGIFGMPKTDAEKVQSEKYKNDLMRQIEEKKYQEARKKEKEREEEQREQRRVEEQQRRMQEEYEEERRRTREKEEEARRKNDELMRLAEERKREADLRRRQEDDRRVEPDRRDRDRDRDAGDTTHVTVRVNEESEELAVDYLEDRRGDSPPVPAARTRQEPQPSTSYDDRGPPARTHSADVLNQLAAMRKQLQNERQRVETMLEKERNEPDVFDPRLVQRPPPIPIVRPEIDVFETARHRNAAPVRRTPADRPSTQAVEDFGTLKYKDDSDSRKEFRRLFPDQPSTGDNLEAQQAAMLRQQEDNLRRLRDQRQYDSGYPKTSAYAPPSSYQSHTPQQLHSNSAFVDVDSLNHFPDDFEDIPTARRNDSHRARRRDRWDSSPIVGSRGGYSDPFGSTTSLNVDRLAKKNEDRLKRLRDMQGDDTSLYDPDDVLDRFMSKQGHNRPPSGRTLQDDTWMFPGSKASGY